MRTNSSSSEAVIVTRNLSKRYRQQLALSEFSVRIQQGEVVGLLGPNGSGKSTLVRLLLGFLNPTSGSAEIMKLDCTVDRVAVHKKVAYLPGDARMFRTMRGIEVLRFFARMRQSRCIQRGLELARRLELDMTCWVAFMSTGMRQKLALCVVLASDAPILILDEPTANLDPTVKAEILSLVKEARNQGRTVLFSTHILSEIEETSDRALILRSGDLVHQQRISDLRNSVAVRAEVAGPLIEIPADLQPQLADLIVTTAPSDDSCRLEFSVTGQISRFLPWLASLPLLDLRIQPVDLGVIYRRFHPINQ